jgi:hypothetical protein
MIKKIIISNSILLGMYINLSQDFFRLLFLILYGPFENHVITFLIILDTGSLPIRLKLVIEASSMS